MMKGFAWKQKKYSKKKGLLLATGDRKYEHHVALHLWIWL